MTWADFTVHLANNINIYIFPCLAVSVILYYILFRKKIISFLDPFTMAVIGSMFGFSTVLFLKITGAINDTYFLQYLLSQMAFWMGFFALNRTPGKDIFHVDNIPLKETPRYFYVYLVVSFIYIVANVITYMVVGIPLFAKNSRLEYVFVGGGFGLITRIKGIFSQISIYLTWYFLVCSNTKYLHRLYARTVLIAVLIFTFFTGSKGAVFGVMTQFFLFVFLNREHCGKLFIKIQKKQIPIIICGLILACITIIIQTHGRILSAISDLAFRFVSYGDTYYMAYPHGIIESLSNTNIFIILFGDFFRTIRILPQNYIPKGMGFELSEIVNKIPNVMVGPNPRHNVYGYVNFGFMGSLIFSLFLGVLLNIARNYSFNIPKKSSQEIKILFLLIYTGVLSVETDFQMVLQNINGILFFFPIIVLLNFTIKYANTNKLKVNLE